jgi:pimeloyl-ACP methyl ester carboxylesterase
MIEPLKPHFFSHNGVQLAYYDEGQGFPLLLIHGFASNAHVNWVHTGWFAALTKAGFRVIAIDNRGHGASQKLYETQDYPLATMAADAAALLMHLQIAKAHVMGYSMGARITSFLCLNHAQLVQSAVISGMGIRLIAGVGTGEEIAVALEAPSVNDVTEKHGRMFRLFAEHTQSDLKALAACVRGSRNRLSEEQAAQLHTNILVVVGTKDEIAGDGQALVDLLPHAKLIALEGKNHMNAVGDLQFKREVIAFWSDV